MNNRLSHHSNLLICNMQFISFVSYIFDGENASGDVAMHGGNADCSTLLKSEVTASVKTIFFG